MTFKQLTDAVNGHKTDSVICVISENETVEHVKQMLAEGKYWVRNDVTAEITPEFPAELFNKPGKLNLDAELPEVDYVIIDSDFDHKGYWKK